MGRFSFSAPLSVKPHLAYDKQLDRMSAHGLTYSDRARALDALRGIGYYRLSAYTYPFREPANEQDIAEGRKRNAQFRHGSTLEDALHLYDFDEKLRVALLRALQTIEVGFAVKVGYTLGKRAPDAHVRIEHLDQSKCLATDSDGRTAYDKWVTRYTKLRSDALQEEFVKHHVLHYEGNIPVWAATGFLDFGAVVRLYSLMTKSDQRKIAHELGLTADSAETLHKWLRALNILRNNCAHNNRVWNRSTVDVPPKFAVQVAPAKLHHLNQIGNDDRQKIYLLAALTAHLVLAVDPRSRWPWETFKTVAKKFGSVAGMTPENTLGFPRDWAELDLWNAPR